MSKFKELADFNAPSGTPFRRARVMNERIRRIADDTSKSLVQRTLEIQAMPYISRGHGKAKNSGNTVCKLLHRVGRSKYQPHQGKQEIARRVNRSW